MLPLLSHLLCTLFICFGLLRRFDVPALPPRAVRRQWGAIAQLGPRVVGVRLQIAIIRGVMKAILAVFFVALAIVLGGARWPALSPSAGKTTTATRRPPSGSTSSARPSTCSSTKRRPQPRSRRVLADHGLLLLLEAWVRPGSATWPLTATAGDACRWCGSAASWSRAI